MAIKVLDYEGLKVLSTKIKSLIDKKANVTDLKTKLAQFEQDSTHRVVTDAEKTKWNNKAEKSYVDNKYKVLNDNKAEKTDLNSYVKKDGNKVLTDNNFSYDLKSKLDRISNKSEAELLNTIWDISYSDRIFNDGNLYQKLNSYAGTNLSSSIRNVDQLLASETGWANFINTNKAVEALYSSYGALEKIFRNSNATNTLLDNSNNYKKILNNVNALLMAFNSEIATNKLMNKSDFIDELIKSRDRMGALINSSIGSKIILNNSDATDKISDSAIGMNSLVDSAGGIQLLYNNSVMWDTLSRKASVLRGGGARVNGKLIIIEGGGMDGWSFTFPTNEYYGKTSINEETAAGEQFTRFYGTYVTSITIHTTSPSRGVKYFKVKEL